MSMPRSQRNLPPRGSRVRKQVAATARLEGMAAEFALLAQRRARVARQIELLVRQRDAAALTLTQVEARMRHLAGHMRLDPGAGPPATSPATAEPAPQPAAAPPARGRGRRNLILEY